MGRSGLTATLEEARAGGFSGPVRIAQTPLERGLSYPSSLRERPLAGLCKKVARDAMAQCGSGAALYVVLPVFEFRKNVVSDVPNRVVKRESPFHVAGHACRPDCGACCIAPSISSPIPGMPNGKPAGVRCAPLGDDLRSPIFGRPRRPPCCSRPPPHLTISRPR